MLVSDGGSAEAIHALVIAFTMTGADGGGLIPELRGHKGRPRETHLVRRFLRNIFELDASSTKAVQIIDGLKSILRRSFADKTLDDSYPFEGLAKLT